MLTYTLIAIVGGIAGRTLWQNRKLKAALEDLTGRVSASQSNINEFNRHYSRLFGDVKVALTNHKEHIVALEKAVLEAKAAELGAVVIEEEEVN